MTNDTHDTSTLPTVAETTTLPVAASLLDEMTNDAERYTESATKDDITVAFYSVLQALSAQLKPGEAKYIKGATQGQILNTVTDELVDGEEGLRLIPVYRKRTFAEYAPPRTGQANGDFVAEHEADVGATMRTKRVTIGNKNVTVITQGSPAGTVGNEVQETHVYAVLRLFDDGRAEPGIITMRKTQFRVGKTWNTRMFGITLPNSDKPAPIFAQVWNLKTEVVRNGDNTWFAWKPVFESLINELPNAADLYARAKELRTQFEMGDAPLKKAQETAYTDADDGFDDNVPF